MCSDVNLIDGAAPTARRGRHWQPGKAVVQVETHQVDPGLLKGTWVVNPVESTSPFKSFGFRCVSTPASLQRGGVDEELARVGKEAISTSINSTYDYMSIIVIC